MAIQIAFARAADQADRTVLSEGDWSRIDTLVQDLIMVVRGLAAPSFAQCAQDAIKLVAADETVVRRFRDIASLISNRMAQQG